MPKQKTRLFFLGFDSLSISLSLISLFLATPSLSSSSSSFYIPPPSCSNLHERLVDRALRGAEFQIIANANANDANATEAATPTLALLSTALDFFADADVDFERMKFCAGIRDEVNATKCLKRVCGFEEEEDEEEDVLLTPSLLRALLVDVLEGRCFRSPELVVHHESRVPWEKSVGYGSAFPATVVIGSQFGGLLYPLRNHIAYKICLTYLIGLACGTLGAGGILHLMPACFGLHEDDVSGPEHIYHSAAVLAGAYLFYWIELILRDFSSWKKGDLFKQISPQPATPCKSPPKTPLESRYQSKHSLQSEPPAILISRPPSEVFDDEVNPSIAFKPEGSRHSLHVLSAQNRRAEFGSVVRLSLANINEISGRSRKVSTRSFVSHASNLVTDDEDLDHLAGQVAPIAWILIMAKIFSTFIDGLTMGAAFTESIAIGIKIGIAIICEEYPHELGDIAVLLNSGMSFKRALLWNFIAASAVFPGVYVGIAAGESSDANPWIFAVAAGMFVYISFVDMVPEVAALRDELMDNGIGYWWVLLIQHLGLLSGFTLMFTMALFGDQIVE